jgi:hypothetical protein
MERNPDMRDEIEATVKERGVDEGEGVRQRKSAMHWTGKTVT